MFCASTPYALIFLISLPNFCALEHTSSHIFLLMKLFFYKSQRKLRSCHRAEHTNLIDLVALAERAAAGVGDALMSSMRSIFGRHAWYSDKLMVWRRALSGFPCLLNGEGAGWSERGTRWRVAGQLHG